MLAMIKVQFQVFFLLSILILPPLISEDKIVYIYARYWSNLFDIGNPSCNRDNSLEPTFRLREHAMTRGYEIRQTHTLQSLENFEYLVIFDIFPEVLPELLPYPKEKLILFMWEPPSVLPMNYVTDFHGNFSKIFTWHDDLIDNKKYFKFYHPALKPMAENSGSFDAKKLCTLISCNKNSSYPTELYSERRNFITFFEQHYPNDFDLYGKWWPASITYKGEVEKKSDCLKQYRFACAYENIKDIPGYVTEKIFDCFAAGCVPVYLGASNIAAYVPKDCFIDRRDFASYEALYAFLKQMDEAHHQQYLDNIKRFLVSQEAQLYSTENFIKIFMESLSFSAADKR